MESVQQLGDHWVGNKIWNFNITEEPWKSLDSLMRLFDVCIKMKISKEWMCGG